MKSNSYLSLPSTLSTFKKTQQRQSTAIQHSFVTGTIFNNLSLLIPKDVPLAHQQIPDLSSAGKLIVSFDFLSSVVLPHAAIQRISIGSSYVMRKTRPVRISPIDQSYKIRHTAMRHLPPLKSCHLDGTHL